MSIIQEAEAYLRENKFKEALRFLIRVLDEHGFEIEDKKIAAEYITRKLKSVMIDNDSDIVWTKIANLWFDNNEYQKSLDAFKKITKRNQDGEIKYKMIVSSIRDGDLHTSALILRKYLDDLVRKKNASKIDETLNRLKSENFNTDQFEKFKKIADVFTGKNIAVYEHEGDREDILHAMANVREQESKYLKNKIYLLTINSHNIKNEKKKIISKIFECYLLGSKYEEHLQTLIEYVSVVKRRELAYLIIRRSSEAESIKNKYKQKLEIMSKNLDNYIPFSASSDDLDLGEDLFSTEFPASKRRDVRIERLKNQYEILMENGYSEQAKEILVILNELDPDHNVVDQLPSNIDKGSRVKSNAKLNEDKIENLLEEVELMSKIYGEKNAQSISLDHQIRVMKKHVQSMVDSVVKTSGKDILISLISMELYEIGLEFIKTKGDLFIDDLAESLYYQSICYFKMSRFTLALEKIDEALLQEMNNSRRCSLLYQKAEMLSSIGKVSHSLQVYRQILKIDPKHKQANFKALQIV